MAQGVRSCPLRAAQRRLDRILLPPALFRASPGFYTALGDVALPHSGDIVRVYWNLRADGATRLVRELTTVLNDVLTPFRSKVVNSQARFKRADAAVLY